MPGPSQTASHPPAQPRKQPSMDVLIQRQIDTISTGNGAYLETFLRAARAADLHVRLVFAPWHAFGNRPWSRIHPQLAALAAEVAWPRTVKLGSRFISLAPRVWVRFGVRLVKEALMRAGVRMVIPSYLGKPLTSDEAAITAAVCKARPATITVAEYSSLGPVLKLLGPGSLHGCLMHDLLSDRASRFRAAGREIDFQICSREEEMSWIESCRVLFFASANEMQVVAPLLPDATGLWLRPDSRPFGLADAKGPARLVFVGTVHAGNEESINHFLADIWPGLSTRLPALELWIAGSIGKRLTPAQASLPGVRVLGRIERLEEIGGPQSIGIAPTRMATGISIKVAEYLMLGMPCIAYPLALEGFGDVLDDLVIRANNPEAFRDRIIELVEDDARREDLSARAWREARGLLANDIVVDYFKSLHQHA